jgi:hypothetical protein
MKIGEGRRIGNQRRERRLHRLCLSWGPEISCGLRVALESQTLGIREK